MNLPTNHEDNDTTPAVYTVTPEKVFVVELWNGDPIPENLFESIREAGFTALAGAGSSFIRLDENVYLGDILLSQMQVMKLD